MSEAYLGSELLLGISNQINSFIIINTIYVIHNKCIYKKKPWPDNPIFYWYKLFFFSSFFTSESRSNIFILFLLQITNLTVLFYFYFRLHILLFYLILTSDYKSYSFVLFLLQITYLTVLFYFYFILHISYCFILFLLQITYLTVLSYFYFRLQI